MAKTQTDKNTPKATPAAAPGNGSRIETLAEDLGRLLGNAHNKANSWLEQRDELVKHLEGVRATATELLTQLGHTATETVQKVRRGRRPKARVKPESNPAGGMKPLHRAQQAPHLATRPPVPVRAQRMLPRARRAPK